MTPTRQMNQKLKRHSANSIIRCAKLKSVTTPHPASLPAPAANASELLAKEIILANKKREIKSHVVLLIQQNALNNVTLFIGNISHQRVFIATIYSGCNKDPLMAVAEDIVYLR